MTESSRAEPTVRYDVEDGVCVITLNRPERLNALTAAMGRSYNEALLRADADPDVRVVVVTGAGRGFCAGAELDVVDAISDGQQEAATPEAGLHPQLARSVRKPVIAAVNGSAAGSGLAILAYADVRFVAAEATLTTSFAHLGLVAEYGLAWTLARLVGPGNAADVLLSSRRFSGAEAGEIGLAQRVLPAAELLDGTLEYARAMSAGCAPRSLATIKRQLVEGMEQPHDVALAVSLDLMQESFSSSDLVEAVAARGERRRPAFLPLES